MVRDEVDPGDEDVEELPVGESQIVHHSDGRCVLRVFF